MTEREALTLALEALEKSHTCPLLPDDCAEAITAIKEALAQPEQEPKRCSLCNYQHGHAIGCANNPVDIAIQALAQPEPKYHRGNRLICLETEEYCVIHISGTDRQWIKFPDSHIGVYTNEQVAELFELLPKEPEQEPAGKFAKFTDGIWREVTDGSAGVLLYTTPPQRTWVGLTDEDDLDWEEGGSLKDLVKAIESKLKEKNDGREWQDLTDDEMLMIYGQNHEGKKYNLGRMVQQALKDKNT